MGHFKWKKNDDDDPTKYAIDQTCTRRHDQFYGVTVSVFRCKGATLIHSFFISIHSRWFSLYTKNTCNKMHRSRMHPRASPKTQFLWCESVMCVWCEASNQRRSSNCQTNETDTHGHGLSGTETGTDSPGLTTINVDCMHACNAYNWYLFVRLFSARVYIMARSKKGLKLRIPNMIYGCFVIKTYRTECVCHCY